MFYSFSLDAFRICLNSRSVPFWTFHQGSVLFSCAVIVVLFMFSGFFNTWLKFNCWTWRVFLEVEGFYAVVLLYMSWHFSVVYSVRLLLFLDFGFLLKIYLLYIKYGRLGCVVRHRRILLISIFFPIFKVILCFLCFLSLISSTRLSCRSLGFHKVSLYTAVFSATHVS